MHLQSQRLAGTKYGARMNSTTQTTLKLLRYFEPATPADLTNVQAQQLVAAGQRYFSRIFDAATLMAEEGAGQCSFHGGLQLREIGDANGQPAYTSLTYMGGSGTIFKAGTTEVIAEIIQGQLECGDEELGEALEAVLALKSAPVAAPKKARKPAAKKKAAPRKAAPKKSSKAKKAASKKPAAKKAAAKKAVKKPAPKKAAAKKPAAKKPAAKKTKKPAPKKKR